MSPTRPTEDLQYFVAKEAPAEVEACSIIENGFKHRCLVTILAECRVDYEGRSSSTLGWGERLILVKGDASVLVHKPEGFEATNWQPPGGALKVFSDSGVVVIEAVRASPREILRAHLRKIYLVSAAKIIDPSNLEMYLSEEQLYDVIALHPESLEAGLNLISTQKRIGEGFADFTARDREGKYVIVEVKRSKADTQSVKQLNKYVLKLQEGRGQIRGILAAPEITREARKLANSLSLDFRQIDLKKYGQIFRLEQSKGQTSLV